MAATLPQAVRQGGLNGPRLSALIAYQKVACHMTYRVIQTFLRDVCQLDFSVGQLVKVVGKASGSPFTVFRAARSVALDQLR